MASRKNFKENKSRRKTTAKLRQEERNKRNNKEQLKILEDRGHGHCKEANKLREN